MTDFDELAQVLIIDMSVISIINTHAKKRQSHQIRSYLLLQNQVCFWSITNTTIFFHWNLNISFFITLKILMNSDSDL